MRTKFAGVLGTIVLLAGWPAAAPASAETPERFDNYVALGDSYTAGPLIPLETTGPLGCVRSSANYPAFLASYLRVRNFTDVSCSAARTEHLFQTQVGILPGSLPENANAPQLLAVTEKTDLVTLGIGGNDFGLFGEMIDHCARLATERPEAATPCKDHFTVDGVDTKLRDAKRIQGNIERALRAITAKAPDATVVVVNYLHILPESGTCADVPFAAGDYVWGTQVHRQLNTSLRNAADAYGATYVDMYGASAGHDACSSDPWVNGATIKPTRAMSFHPYRSGMKAIADTTYSALTGQSAPLGIPAVSLVKRLPALIDVEGLLTYVARGGRVPIEVIDDPGAPREEPPVVDGEQPGPALEDPVTDDELDAAVVDAVEHTLDAADSAASAVASSGGPAKVRTAAPNTSRWGLLPDTGGPTLVMIVLALACIGVGGRLSHRRRRT